MHIQNLGENYLKKNPAIPLLDTVAKFLFNNFCLIKFPRIAYLCLPGVCLASKPLYFNSTAKNPRQSHIKNSATKGFTFVSATNMSSFLLWDPRIQYSWKGNKTESMKLIWKYHRGGFKATICKILHWWGTLFKRSLNTDQLQFGLPVNSLI